MLRLRTVTPGFAGLRLLLVTATALLAAACDGIPSPEEPPVLEDGVPAGAEAVPMRQDLASLLGDRAHWADGYLSASNPITPFYTPASSWAFNRSGGSMTITKLEGTTGRYIATFTGLSGFLGGRSTVHVTSYYSGGAGIPDDTYCKPIGAFLVSDKIEVRCFRMSTGAASNSSFTVLVTRNYSDLAFAYAHQPTGSNYSPSAQGSWNPAGTSKVFRSGVGQYQVVFSNLGSQLPTNVGGHVQVNAVGTGKAHCKAHEFGGSPDLRVSVQCYTSAGALVDSKFTVLFLLPADHLAYAWADRPTADSYTPYLLYTSHPTSGTTYISRSGVGQYTVEWAGVDPAIYSGGGAQVTAYGTDNAQCKVYAFLASGIRVQCFAPNGSPVDAYYMVLFHS